ncbi:MAG: CDP-glycerol glycerophosphotransferase family protein, partial [Clostridia bacterium]|nr:CDP-glycerol glycerophosphotransferase family protein [Clostridia bacterium]
SLMRKDVEYIYIPHDMMSVHMGFREGALDHFDTVFCTGPHVAAEVRETERVYSLPAKKLIEFGYPLTEKLEASCIALGDVRNDKKEILIAPSWQEDNLLDSCLDGLLASLVRDGSHVTVRPHPEYSKRYPDRIKAMTARFADIPDDKLTFELDFTTNKSIYSSDILITDWSGIAYEFAFATKKPVLFINTKMKSENPNWQRIPLTPVEISLRDRVGISLEKTELSQSAEAVDKLIDGADAYREKITEILHSHLYSYGTNGAEGVRYILTRLKEIQDKKKNEV